MEATEIGTSPDAELANSSLRQACAQLREGEHPRGYSDCGGLNAGRGGSGYATSAGSCGRCRGRGARRTTKGARDSSAGAKESSSTEETGAVSASRGSWRCWMATWFATGRRKPVLVLQIETIRPDLPCLSRSVTVLKKTATCYRSRQEKKNIRT